MTSTELKHQAQIVKWTKLTKNAAAADYRLKRGASRPKLYTEHLLSMGAERAGKCRNESAFEENGFRRSAGAENGEPKRFSIFRYTPYR